MKYVRKWLLATCFVLCTLALAHAMPLLMPAEAAGGFSVSGAFSSNMVLQRDEPIRVFGWADESRDGETVTVTFAGKTAEGKIEDGEWLVTFDEGFSVSAAMGNDMVITSGTDKVVLEDVLVGDVYMVIGQSNVAYSVENHCAGKGVNINTLVDPNAPIRLKYNTLNDTAGYPTRGTEEVCPDVINGRGWWLPTVANARSFTAIGYLFAQEIVEKTEGGVPIGLIEIDGNGQPIGAFMPNEVAGATASDTFDKGKGIYVPPGVNGVAARYMYNHYMYPYERYAMAGVIWYQGESDFEQKNTETYVDKFVALMEHMRSTHNLKNKDFPVYIVELPTAYNKPADFAGDFFTMDLGYIRAEMGSIPQRLSNSYLAVSSDTFTDERFWNSLHPNIKDAQARRLADIAASVWYELGPLDRATGPVLKDYAISEDRKTVTLTFDNVGEGLTTADGGKTVKGFVALNRIGGLSPKQQVSATITGKDQVTVTSGVAMYGVAYNCVMDNFYGKEINLCNSHERIASAFTYSELRMEQIRHELVGDGAVRGEPAADVLAVRFRTTGEAVAIGTQIANTDGRTGTLKLSLYRFDTDYATTVAKEPVSQKSFSDLNNYAWAELTSGRNRIWEAGEYLLVLSEADGITLTTGGSHEGQMLYRDGQYAEGTSLLLGVTYESAVEAPYGIPGETETDTDASPTTDPAASTSDAATDSDVTADGTVEAEAPVEDGCASTLGGVLCTLCLLLPAAVLVRRRD